MHINRFSLLTTAFLTGAGILVIEIMGTRLLAPFFGSGVYTWSALITITMAALALGYAFGGYLADRYANTVLLYGLILAGALWTAITPFLASQFIPNIIQSLDIRLSVILSSIVLFFPGLFLLATVGPFVIRLITNLAENAGKCSGLVFATSTIGSLLGALLTGFYLIPTLSVSRSFQLCAILLAIVSMTGLIGSAKKYLGAGLSILLFIILLPGILQKPPGTTTPKIVAQSSSYYGQIQVIDNQEERILLVDGIGQNYVYQDGAYSTQYINFISALPRIHKCHQHKKPRALVIGLGAGQIPMQYVKAGIDTDVVEIDEAVIHIARKYFGFDIPANHIHAVDGRVYLTHNTTKYDYLILDAFLADQIAWHLLSIEALSQTKNRLSDNGMLVINITSSMGGDDIASVVNTLRQIFPNIHTYVYPYASGLASHVVIASNHAIEWSLDSFEEGSLYKKQIKDFMKIDLQHLKSSLVLRDDYNPLSTLRRDMGVLWRTSMWKYLGDEDLSWLIN